MQNVLLYVRLDIITHTATVTVITSYKNIGSIVYSVSVFFLSSDKR